jgi:hypothetical protein
MPGHVFGDDLARIGLRSGACGLTCDNGGGRLRCGVELGDLAWRQGAVERVGGRHRTDQDQHDQAHALLAIVGAMGIADAGAGEDQEAADPPWRRLIALRLGIERRDADDETDGEQQERRGGEADQRRQQQRLADLGGLGPVHARRAVLAAHQRIGDADADDRADQRV